MPKDAYYFPHDANARNDPKIRAMRTVYGSEGVGWYWMLVEMLREQESYRLAINGYTWNALAMDLNCQPEQIKKFIKDCCTEFHDGKNGLLQFDDNFIWSESLLRRMGTIDGKRIQARDAAYKRWHYDGNASALLPQSVGNASKVKKSKVNKIKENEIKIEENLLSTLKNMTNPSHFKTYLSELKVIDANNHKITLGVRNEWTADYISKNCMNMIKQALNTDIEPDLILYED